MFSVVVWALSALHYRHCQQQSGCFSEERRRDDITRSDVRRVNNTTQDEEYKGRANNTPSRPCHTLRLTTDQLTLPAPSLQPTEHRISGTNKRNSEHVVPSNLPNVPTSQSEAGTALFTFILWQVSQQEWQAVSGLFVSLVTQLIKLNDFFIVINVSWLYFPWLQ